MAAVCSVETITIKMETITIKIEIITIKTITIKTIIIKTITIKIQTIIQIINIRNSPKSYKDSNKHTSNFFKQLINIS